MVFIKIIIAKNNKKTKCKIKNNYGKNIVYVKKISNCNGKK